MAQDKRKQRQSRFDVNHPKAQKPPPPMCAYCGIRPGLEVEHVIARCFFSESPKEFIKVPACASCNRSMSKDEEYVRNAMRVGSGIDPGSEAGRRAIDTVLRSLQRSKGLETSIFGSTQWVTLQFAGPEGYLFPEIVPIFTVDADRVRRVARKIVRGLYYHHERVSLPVNITIEVFPGVPWDVLQKTLKMFGDARWNIVSDTDFAYLKGRVLDHLFWTAWVLLFNRTIPVFAHTFPENERHLMYPKHDSVLTT